MTRIDKLAATITLLPVDRFLRVAGGLLYEFREFLYEKNYSAADHACDSCDYFSNQLFTGECLGGRSANRSPRGRRELWRERAEFGRYRSAAIWRW
jgi:hypothetical protein